MDSKFDATEKYWTAEEVAERYRVSIHGVWKWVRQGKLQAVKIGPRSMRIPESSLVELEENSLVPHPEYKNRGECEL